MSKPIFKSDLNILLKLFTSNTFQLDVWDPNQRIVFDTDEKSHKQTIADFKVLVFVSNNFSGYDGLVFEAYDLILDFSNIIFSDARHKKDLNFINSPNGKMRWLYSDANRKATFLKFYNTGSLKAKCIAAGIKTMCFLGLQRTLGSGSLKIHSKQPLKIQTLLNEVEHTDYSLFLGSEGNKRTVLVESHTHNSPSSFFKIPISKESQRSVSNEKWFLQVMKNHSFQSIEVPEIRDISFNDVLLSNDLRSKTSKRSVLFSKVHAEALTEFFSKTKQFTELKKSQYWSDILDLNADLKIGSSFKTELGLVQKLKSQIRNKVIYTNLYHGDFTPWNMFVNENVLQVYDWELAKSQMPLLFDLFHFHFQKGVLQKRISFDSIKDDIYAACKLSSIKNIIEVYNIDIEEYLQLYVLYAASTYLVDFQKQPNLNIQNQWLLQSLMIAVKSSINTTDMEIRSNFISDFNIQIGNAKHAYLKLLVPEITQLPAFSDLDILIEKQHIKSMVSFCREHPSVLKVNTRTKSFMTIVEIFFINQEFLSIDLIHEFKRTDTLFMDSSAVLNNTQLNNCGYRIPNPVFDFEYTFLFYQLNGASIPVKYQEHFLGMKKEDGLAIPSHLKLKYGLNQYSSKELMQFSPLIQKKLNQQLYGASLNIGIARIINVVQYISDTASDLLFNHAKVITFSGVDGAGKTTIIQNIKEQLQNKYRKDVVLLRHRPGILPILSAIRHGKEEAEKIASVTLPRKGKNSGILSSIARFSYYFGDYVLGQVYVYVNYTMRGKTVVYDRYYFDFINDAKRSNIELNRGFVQSLYRFIFKPDLNIFLYADAETILKRKQEMNKEEIVRISSLYKNLFGQLKEEKRKGTYTCIENKDLNDTINQVIASYQKVA